MKVSKPSIAETKCQQGLPYDDSNLGHHHHDLHEHIFQLEAEVKRLKAELADAKAKAK